MVAYNFKPQFEKPIQAGKKRQTIRALGKRRHARPGEMLQLYTGMRTKSCRKIMPDQRCAVVVGVVIEVRQDGLTVNVGGEHVEDLEGFARMDGFLGANAMRDFWIENHGLGTFVGVLVGW